MNSTTYTRNAQGNGEEELSCGRIVALFERERKVLRSGVVEALLNPPLSRSAVAKALYKLVKQGRLEKLCHGYYGLPGCCEAPDTRGEAEWSLLLQMHTCYFVTAKGGSNITAFPSYQVRAMLEDFCRRGLVEHVNVGRGRKPAYQLTPAGQNYYKMLT